VTTQARAKSGDESFAEMKHPSGRTIYWNVFKEGAGSGAEGTDAWAVAQGYVSVTPMRARRRRSLADGTWRQLSQVGATS
jgi:broad specificity polyphosphatase/5'/3'-nucleotidase SurE